jgi:hypothetical protein
MYIYLETAFPGVQGGCFMHESFQRGDSPEATIPCKGTTHNTAVEIPLKWCVAGFAKSLHYDMPRAWQSPEGCARITDPRWPRNSPLT